MRRRAERLEETRRRIVEATVSLHEEVGPSRTTVAAIAVRAGVSRPTVYNQFPDNLSLFTACGGRFAEQHPLPELTGIELEDALVALYRHFADNQRMLDNVERDVRLLPALAQVYAQPLAALDQAADWHAGRLTQRDKRVGAVVRLAFSFGTWQQLDRAGLSVTGAASLMTALARAAATR
jgi:AcrR family transcriptional regulator